MAEIVPLTPGALTGERRISDACVRVLRELLDRAEAGEVTGVGIIALHCDGCASWHVAGQVGGYSMLGALDMVRADLVDINRGLE